MTTGKNLVKFPQQGGGHQGVTDIPYTDDQDIHHQNLLRLTGAKYLKKMYQTPSYNALQYNPALLGIFYCSQG